MEKHPLALPCDDEKSNFDNYDSSNDDLSVEITSTIDEHKKELVGLSTYHPLELKNSSYDNNEEKKNIIKKMMVEKPKNSYLLNSKTKQFSLDQFMKK
ncbi:unnamed protein product [Rotaria sp. Silwood2]|nr:unnamed protein product [Rotaria sp. Silwood2]